jgi:hypothetical protein
MAVETLSNITQDEIDYSNFVIKSQLNYQCEMIQVRRWGIDEGIEIGKKIAREEYRQYVLELLNQGLTIEEIKARLQQEAN